MHEQTVFLLLRFWDEIEDLFRYLVLVVEYELSIVVQPVESQVLDTHWGPLVEDLSTCTVDDMCDFIGNYELQVLSWFKRMMKLPEKRTRLPRTTRLSP